MRFSRESLVVTALASIITMCLVMIVAPGCQREIKPTGTITLYTSLPTAIIEELEQEFDCQTKRHIDDIIIYAILESKDMTQMTFMKYCRYILVLPDVRIAAIVMPIISLTLNTMSDILVDPLRDYQMVELNRLKGWLYHHNLCCQR